MGLSDIIEPIGSEVSIDQTRLNRGTKNTYSRFTIISNKNLIRFSENVAEIKLDGPNVGISLLTAKMFFIEHLPSMIQRFYKYTPTPPVSETSSVPETSSGTNIGFIKYSEKYNDPNSSDFVTICWTFYTDNLESVFSVLNSKTFMNGNFGSTE